MLTLQDLNNCLIFLNRVDLKGNESMAMTDIQIKLQSMRSEIEKQMQEQQNAVVPPQVPEGDGEGKTTEH